MINTRSMDTNVVGTESKSPTLTTTNTSSTTTTTSGRNPDPNTSFQPKSLLTTMWYSFLSWCLFFRYYCFIVPIDFLSVCADYVYIPVLNTKVLFNWEFPLTFVPLKRTNWRIWLTLFVLCNLTMNNSPCIYYFQRGLNYLRELFLCDGVRLSRSFDLVEATNILMKDKLTTSKYFFRREICKYI